MAGLVLYGADYSVYSRIARLVCLELGLDHDFIQTDIFTPEDLPTEFAGLNPFGKIPVLKDGDFTLYETGAITRYLNHLSSEASLVPQDSRDQARMDQVIGLLDSYGYRAMVWDLFVEGRKDDPDAENLNRGEEQALRCLDCLTDIMGNAPYLAGTNIPSLADFHAYPMICYLALHPGAVEWVASREPLLKWFAGMADRPSVQETVSPLEAAAR